MKRIKYIVLFAMATLFISFNTVKAESNAIRGAEKVDYSLTPEEQAKINQAITAGNSTNIFESIIVSTNATIREKELNENYVKFLFNTAGTFWHNELLSGVNVIYGIQKVITFLFNSMSFLPSLIMFLLVNASDTNFTILILSPLQNLTNQLFNWGDVEGFGISLMTVIVLITIVKNLVFKDTVNSQLGFKQGVSSIIQSFFGAVATGVLIVVIAQHGIPFVRNIEQKFGESVTVKLSKQANITDSVIHQKRLIFDIFNLIPFEHRHFGNATPINVPNEIKRLEELLESTTVDYDIKINALKTSEENVPLEDIALLEAEKHTTILQINEKLTNLRKKGDVNEVTIDERKYQFLANASDSKASEEYNMYLNTGIPNEKNANQIMLLSFLQIFQTFGSTALIGVPYIILFIVRITRELSLIFSVFFLIMGMLKRNKIILHWAFNQLSWILVMTFITAGFEIGLYYISILVRSFLAAGIGGLLLFSILSVILGIFMFKNKDKIFEWVKSFTKDMLQNYSNPGVNPLSEIREATIEKLNVNSKGKGEFGRSEEVGELDGEYSSFNKNSKRNKATANDSLADRVEKSGNNDINLGEEIISEIPGEYDEEVSLDLEKSEYEIQKESGYRNSDRLRGIADIDEVLLSPKSESLDVQRIRSALDRSPITESQQQALDGQPFVNYKGMAKHRVEGRKNIYDPRNQLEAAQIISYLYGITDVEPIDVPKKEINIDISNEKNLDSNAKGTNDLENDIMSLYLKSSSNKYNE